MTSIKLVLLFLTTLYFYKYKAQANFFDVYEISGRQLQKGKYAEALNTNLTALESAEKTTRPKLIAVANIQVANVHYFLKDRESAIKWYMKAMAIIESHKIDSLMPEVYHNTSVMYNELHNIDSTLKYEIKAIDILKKSEHYGELSKALSALVDVYLYQVKKPSEAEKLIIEAERYAQLSRDSSFIGFAAIKRAQFMAGQFNYKEAIEHLKIAEAAYRKDKLPEELMSLYYMKGVWMIKSGEAKGLNYIEKSSAIKDSLYKKESADKIASYQTKYETEKKERENKLLQQENKVKELQLKSRNRTILILGISILLIVFLVLWRMNVINLRKKEQALLTAQKIHKEKERISRDLHDNVGGQLSYVLYSIDSINENDQQKKLELTNSVRAVIGSLRETIWAINDESITVNDLFDKLKMYTRSMFKSTSTKVIYSEDAIQNLSLNSTTGLNVYRICQEIINNCFKHSQAGELRILFKADTRLVIEISDNGKGFDLSKDYSDSYGLANIKARAIETGIELSVSSQPGKGTLYSMIV